MSRILAIDTATEACSAALWMDGEVTERYEVAPRQHAKLILPMAQGLLADAGLALPQLDGVAFGRGPGSFTGLRIAAGVVQGLAFGADLPVLPVSTLATLAQGAVDDELGGDILAGIDARMKQVYWGVYQAGDDGLVQLVGEEQVCDPEQVPAVSGDDWVGAGTAWEAYGQALWSRLGSVVREADGERLPRAAAMLSLADRLLEDGGAVAAENALPVYLRDQVVQRPGGKV